jgi:hypothetical protein
VTESRPSAVSRRVDLSRFRLYDWDPRGANNVDVGVRARGFELGQGQSAGSGRWRRAIVGHGLSRSSAMDRIPHSATFLAPASTAFRGNRESADVERKH